ncbi:MAG: hypothetical protein JXJ17_05600 [Anaerolineae bacterium]|nr:hypothetical protein [Anaerolineae bacterium]
MASTVLHRYEEWLAERRDQEEIASSTYNAYLNDASRVFEVLLLEVPPYVIEGYLKAAGYRRTYSHVIENLRKLARPRRVTVFRKPSEKQRRLPGL